MIKTFLTDTARHAWEMATVAKLWLPELRHWDTLKADIIAGVTVALVMVPQVMAYAQLAGLPAYTGLYAAFVAPIVAAIFGSSRQLHNGPVAVISLMTASALSLLPLEPAQMMGYAAFLAVLVGVIQMGLGLLRLGFLVDFLSHPVISGFTNAAAIVIGSLQLGKLLGVAQPSDQQFLLTLRDILFAIPTQAHGPTMLMGLGSLGLIFAFKRWAPRWPSIVLTVVVATFASWLFDYQSRGGAVVGVVPNGLPGIEMPPNAMEHIPALLLPALTIALLSFVEAFSIAKAVASKTRQRISADQEMVGKGLANIATGFTQGYPVSGSFSRTAVNFDAGARTGFAAIVSGLLVALTLLFLTPLLYFLPLATLAAVIMAAVFALIQFEPFKHAWKVNPHDGFVALITFLVTLWMAPHLEYGIFVGVGLSIAFYLYRTMQPHVAELARDEDDVLRDAALYGLKTSQTLAMYRYDGDLYFANAGYLEKTLLNAVADKPHLRVLILDLEAVDQIDATGEEMLGNLADGLHQANISFYICRPKFKLLDAIKRSGLHDKIGDDSIFSKRKNAIQAAVERFPGMVDISHLMTYQPDGDADLTLIPSKPQN